MKNLPQRAFQDPLGWASELIGVRDEVETYHDDILKDAEALVPLATRAQELETLSGRTSREIGAAKVAGKDPAPAIAAMRELAAESRTVVQQLRAGLEALAACIGVDEDRPELEAEIGPPPPAYFEWTTAQFVKMRGAGDALEDISVSPIESPSDANDYARYSAAHPAHTAYHEIGLRHLVATANAQRSHHLIARSPNGVVRGVLPLVRLSSSLFGNYMVSMPWFNYGGPLADDDATSDALMQAAIELAREQRCSHVEIRETSPREGWKARTDKVSMTLALPDTVEALDKGFGASLRAQSNKAVRAGCTFRVGGRELLEDFYRVFCINMRDLGTPVQSRAFFDGLLELFGDDAFLTVVSRDGRPLAAAFLLAHGGETLEIPWASSLRKANSLGVNMLLYRRTIGEAVTRGYRHFDFGRSTAGGPTWRFKKQWGAVPRQLYWHYWTADGSDMAGPSADSPKFRLAVAAWQRLPVALTRRLGPSLVRGLP